jgi:hypothetical protein
MNLRRKWEDWIGKLCYRIRSSKAGEKLFGKWWYNDPEFLEGLYRSFDRWAELRYQKHLEIESLDADEAAVMAVKLMQDPQSFRVYKGAKSLNVELLPPELKEFLQRFPHFYALKSAIEVDVRKIKPLGRDREFDSTPSEVKDQYLLLGFTPKHPERGQLLMSMDRGVLHEISDWTSVAELSDSSGWSSVYRWVLSQDPNLIDIDSICDDEEDYSD